MYIDLNPIRAGLADTPETSEFTGAFERIAARQQPCDPAAEGSRETANRPACAATHTADEAPRAAADWLSPIPAAGLLPRDAVVERPPSPYRASQQGFLPLELNEYLELLDWTGRQIRSDKPGAIPADLQPILDRLRINTDAWIETVTHLGRRFHRAIGTVPSMAARAAGSGKRWLHGLSASRLAFS